MFTHPIRSHDQIGSSIETNVFCQNGFANVVGLFGFRDAASPLYSRYPFSLQLVLILVAIIGLHFGDETSRLLAGQTAANWIIAVNGDSISSRTIANTYARLRDIPDQNIVVLSGIPKKHDISAKAFQEKILQPILLEIQKRKLGKHINGIAYSSGFPTRVNVKELRSSVKGLPKVFTPFASINGATYLLQLLNANDARFFLFDANRYASDVGDVLFRSPSFDAQWAPWKRFTEAKRSKKHELAAQLAGEILEEYPRQYPIAYSQAIEYAKAGKREKAIESLGKAIELGWRFGKTIKSETAFDTIRNDAKFQVLRDSCEDIGLEYLPSRGFSARVPYSANYVTVNNDQPEKGRQYLLSMVLAVTRAAGLTLDESIEQLERAARSDQTYPIGTFLFARTRDVRSTTRAKSFPMAIKELESLGQQARPIRTVTPENVTGIMGLTLGTPTYRLEDKGNELLPGAIVDNFTSHGGIMSQLVGQTKLSVALRFGAAASSGTVTEPYALQPKFPHPMLHVHYARGLTIAEAFYASVTGPYQLLIVGDPLANPYGRVPMIETAGPKEFEVIGTKVDISVGQPRRGFLTRPKFFQILVNGGQAAVLKARQKFDIDVSSAPDGAHEMRIIATDGSELSNKFEVKHEFWLSNQGIEPDDFKLELDSESKNRVRKDELPADAKIKIEATVHPDIGDVILVHGQEKIAKLNAGSAFLEIPVSRVGYDQVKLRLVGVHKDKPIQSKPIIFQLKVPAELGAARPAR